MQNICTGLWGFFHDWCFCITTSSDWWYSKNIKSWWPSYATFYTKCFQSVPHFVTWIITSHKQFPVHSPKPELLAFIFSPPPPLFHMVGVHICHPSNSPPGFALLKCSISWFPTSPSSIPISLGVPPLRRGAPCMHPSPQCYLNPSPSLFTLPLLFRSLLCSPIGVSKNSNVPPYNSFP